MVYALRDVVSVVVCRCQVRGAARLISRRSLGGLNCYSGLYYMTYCTSTWHQPDERLRNDVGVCQEPCNKEKRDVRS